MHSTNNKNNNVNNNKKERMQMRKINSLCNALFNEYLQYESTMSVAEEAQDSIQVDSARLGDLMDYLGRHKYLSDIVVNGEHRLAQYKEFQEWAISIASNPNDEFQKEVALNLGHIKKWAKEHWLEESTNIDRSLGSIFDKDEVFETREEYTAEAKIYNYLLHMTDKMSARQLFKAKDRIFFLRNERKEGREGLGYPVYVKCMLLVLEQIVKTCNSSQALLNRFQEMQWALDTVNCSEDVRIESCASMSINIEDAIDLKREAERLANKHNISLQEAFLMLQAEKEGEPMTQLSFMLDAADNDNEYEDNFYIESNNE